MEHKPHVFVAISGFGGSGKSSLADRLRDHFNIREGQVIRIDHLYSDNPNGPGILDQVDWTLLREILTNAHLGKDLSYTGRGYRGEPIVVSEPLPKVILVEGIRLLQPSLLPFFDMTVWMDLDQKTPLERAKARDRSQGEDEATVSLWDTDWGPKDAAYFNQYRPDTLATLLIPGKWQQKSGICINH